MSKIIKDLLSLAVVAFLGYLAYLAWKSFSRAASTVTSAAASWTPSSLAKSAADAWSNADLESALAGGNVDITDASGNVIQLAPDTTNSPAWSQFVSSANTPFSAGGTNALNDGSSYFVGSN